MKTIYAVALIAIFGSVSVSSCSKKADNITPAQTQTTTPAQVAFQVKIDGKDYTPDFAYALASFPGIDNYYAIYGLDSKTSDVVLIALPNTAIEGTYPFNEVIDQ